MLEQLLGYLDHAGQVITLAAVAVIVVGFALSATRYVFRIRKAKAETDFKQFKIELGSALTLGLEILVLADVIETITVELTFLSLAVLALLVLVRTILSWTLTVEIEGRWPWQSPADEQGGDVHV